MNEIPFGAIVLIAFPFTDLTATKRRPALVISTDNDCRNDVVLAFITSNVDHDKDSMAIDATPATGLKAPSLVRFDKIASLSRAIIVGRIGNADPIWLAAARNVFFGVFGFEWEGHSRA